MGTKHIFISIYIIKTLAIASFLSSGFCPQDRGQSGGKMGAKKITLGLYL
jgi:hypothetical protein